MAEKGTGVGTPSEDGRALVNQAPAGPGPAGFDPSCAPPEIRVFGYILSSHRLLHRFDYAVGLIRGERGTLCGKLLAPTKQLSRSEAEAYYQCRRCYNKAGGNP